MLVLIHASSGAPGESWYASECHDHAQGHDCLQSSIKSSRPFHPILQYTNVLQGRLIKRYKRFLADVHLNEDNGPGTSAETSATVVHCPNTGPMTGLLDRWGGACMVKSRLLFGSLILIAG